MDLIMNNTSNEERIRRQHASYLQQQQQLTAASDMMLTIDDYHTYYNQQQSVSSSHLQPINADQQSQPYPNTGQLQHTQRQVYSPGGVMVKPAGTPPVTPRRLANQTNNDSSTSLQSFASLPPKRSSSNSVRSISSNPSYSKTYRQHQQERRSRSHASARSDSGYSSEEQRYYPSSSSARRLQRHRNRVGLGSDDLTAITTPRLRSRSNSTSNTSKSAQKLLASSRSSPSFAEQQYDSYATSFERNIISKQNHQHYGSEHESDMSSSMPTFPPSEARESDPLIQQQQQRSMNTSSSHRIENANYSKNIIQEMHNNDNNKNSPSSVGRGSSNNNNKKGSSSVRGSSPARSHPSTTTSARADHQHNELIRIHAKLSRRVVDELNRAQFLPERRTAAITNACDAFDHEDETRHNIELQYGAALSLSKLLLLSYKDDEIRMTLSALEMVFRASPKHTNIAFNKVSQNLLYNLLRIIDRLETKKHNVKHADVSILNISKIFYYLSRSSDLRVMLCRPHGMLQALARVSSRTMNPECRLLRVRIIANLANCGDENKLFLYEQEGLVNGLLRVAHFDTSEIIRQYAATALMELSSASSNQLLMAKNEVLISTLVKLILTENYPVTRESAITTFQNLAYTKENRLKLVTLKGGIVLEALKKVISTDEDAKSRRRAAGSLTNLAFEGTAQIMGSHKGLVKTLAIVATKDDSEDVQARASLALTKIASHITVNMECHETVLDALVAASLSKAPNSVVAVFRVKARQPNNRDVLARHPGVVDTLCDICVSDGSSPNDRENAIHAIMNLTNEDKNRKILGTNKNILDALVKVASNGEGNALLEDARDSAIRALQRLATEVSNRYTMAHHPGLLVAVSKAVERESLLEQQADAQYHGGSYLAKPLLLTLLVAM